MRRTQKPLAVPAILIVTALGGCSNGEHGSQEHESSRGEHDRDGGEHDRGGEGEESGTELALHERYDDARGGAHLILAYDERAHAFKGTVENTTERPLERVRVEVHLSNGVELGPTPVADLAPGEKRVVELTPTGRDFDRWTAHPEVGSGEHGHGEGGGEHD